MPDSGILAMIYFLDLALNLKLISLWADPTLGILRHPLPTPNALLRHHPLIASEKKLSAIDVQKVYDELLAPQGKLLCNP